MTHEHQGQCLYCHESNSYTELTCKRCNRWLPWATALQRVRQATAPLEATPPAAPPTGNQVAPATNYLTRAQPAQSVHRVQQPLQQPLQQPPAVSNALAAEHQYCIHCGSAHIKEAAYCPACGTPIASQHVAVVSPAPAPVQQRRRGRSQPQPTLAPAMPSPMYAGPHQIYQPSVNVSVVTEQKADSLGLLARFLLFLFKCTLVLAFLGGVVAALTSR